MITFREIKLQDASLLLNWRSLDHVSKFMNTDISQDLNHQKEWINSCYSKKDFYHWIIQYFQNDIGYINFSKLNKKNKSTSWGFYIGESNLQGLGGLIPPFFYNYAFDRLFVDFIFASVFHENFKVIKMHLKHGYEFVNKSNKIFKNSYEIDVKLMVLKKDVFKNSNFSKFKEIFPTSLWTCR